MNIVDKNEKWTEMKHKVNDAFHYTVVSRHGSSYDRLMQILFVLPHIRNVGLQLLRWLYQVKEERGGLLCDLLQEMLNANTSLDRLNHNGGSGQHNGAGLNPHNGGSNVHNGGLNHQNGTNQHGGTGITKACVSRV